MLERLTQLIGILGTGWKGVEALRPHKPPEDSVVELPIPEDFSGAIKSESLEPLRSSVDPLAPPEPEEPRVGRSPLQDMAEHHEPDMIKGKRVDHTADHSHGRLRHL